MQQYQVVKFTVMAYSKTHGMVPTDIEFRYEDKGDGIEPKSLHVAGDLFTISSACDRMRTDK
jgi:hypothetical protein